MFHLQTDLTSYSSYKRTLPLHGAVERVGRMLHLQTDLTSYSSYKRTLPLRGAVGDGGLFHFQLQTTRLLGGRSLLWQLTRVGERGGFPRSPPLSTPPPIFFRRVELTTVLRRRRRSASTLCSLPNVWLMDSVVWFLPLTINEILSGLLCCPS